MTSGSILPTFGLVPPGLRRTPVPRELQPDLPDPAENLRNNPPTPELDERETPGFSEDESTGRPIAVSGTVALSAQEEETEDQLPSQQPPPQLPSDSPASRRLEQAVEAATQSDEDDENAQGLTEEEEAQVRDLQERDREVRAHEQAHAAVGGIYAGAPTYEFVTGPDGRRYAVSGRVQIDTAEIEGDPEATIEKLETVRRAALAPAEPSAQDRRVAQAAAAGITEARAELQEERAEEQAELTGADEGDDDLEQTVTDQLAESRDINETGEDEDEEETGFANTLQAQAAFSQASLTQGFGGSAGQLTRPTGIDLLA